MYSKIVLYEDWHCYGMDNHCYGMDNTIVFATMGFPCSGYSNVIIEQRDEQTSNSLREQHRL